MSHMSNHLLRHLLPSLEIQAPQPRRSFSGTPSNSSSAPSPYFHGASLDTPATSPVSSPVSFPRLRGRDLRCGNGNRHALPHSRLGHHSYSNAISTPSECAEESRYTVTAASIDDLPPCRELRGVEKTNQNCIAVGGHSEIFVGKLKTNRGHNEVSSPVAIKVVRIPGSCDDLETLEKFKMRLRREMKLWHLLNDPNVLRCFGFSLEFGRFPALVSPFCPSGDLASRLKNRHPINKASVALGMTSGLEYLHSRGIIHADIKSRNVLIGPNGEALICDYGISKIIGCAGFTTKLAGTPSFMAPELFSDEDDDVTPSHTKETDVWAYGLVLLHLFTGKEPILRRSPVPKRRFYSPLDEDIWMLAEACCDLDPAQRPTMEKLLRNILPSIDTISHAR